MSTEQWKLKDAAKLEHKEDDDNHCIGPPTLLNTIYKWNEQQW